MKVVIIPGHTLIGKGTGAVGYINESKETRILNDLIVKWLKIGELLFIQEELMNQVII